MIKKECCQIFGISYNAVKQEIKLLFIRLIRVHHSCPPGKKFDHAKFQTGYNRGSPKIVGSRINIFA